MLALFTVGLIALYAAAQSYARVAADRSYDRLLAGSALSITETLSVADGAILVDVPYAALDMLSAAPDDKVFYRVIGPDGRTVTGYPDLPVVRSPERDEGGSDAALTTFFDANYRGEKVRFVSIGREIAQPGSRGWVWVEVGQTRLAREQLRHELVVRAVLPIIVFILLALAGVWFGITRALRPLDAIGQELARREPSALQPVMAPVPSEIAPVIESLNMFMRRLRENIDNLRAFIGDAAHQMRTPLAGMLAQAQVSSGGDVAELREAMGKIERNAVRLTRLLNQLLSDATVQHRSDMRRFESFDLKTIVEQAIRELLPQTAESDIRFRSSLETAPVTGDALLFGEAIKNLIHNALVHGRGEHREVTIGLQRAQDGYRLTVSDRGPGIREDQKERVFERFARGEASTSGAGLGLAIVRQAIESHGGTIRLADRKWGGLRVEVTLPRNAP